MVELQIQIRSCVLCTMFYAVCSRLCADGRNSNKSRWRSWSQTCLRNYSVSLRTDMTGCEDYHQKASTLDPESDRSLWRMNLDTGLKELRKDLHIRESGRFNMILFISCNVATADLSYHSAKVWSRCIISCPIEIRHGIARNYLLNTQVRSAGIDAVMLSEFRPATNVRGIKLAQNATVYCWDTSLMLSLQLVPSVCSVSLRRFPNLLSLPCP